MTDRARVIEVLEDQLDEPLARTTETWGTSRAALAAQAAMEAMVGGPAPDLHSGFVATARLRARWAVRTTVGVELTARWQVEAPPDEVALPD